MLRKFLAFLFPIRPTQDGVFVYEKGEWRKLGPDEEREFVSDEAF